MILFVQQTDINLHLPTLTFATSIAALLSEQIQIFSPLASSGFQAHKPKRHELRHISSHSGNNACQFLRFLSGEMDILRGLQGSDVAAYYALIVRQV